MNKVAALTAKILVQLALNKLSNYWIHELYYPAKWSYSLVKLFFNSIAERRPLEARCDNGLNSLLPPTSHGKHNGPLPTTKPPPKPARLLTISHTTLRDSTNQQGPAPHRQVNQSDQAALRPTNNSKQNTQKHTNTLHHSQTDPALQRQFIFWPVGSEDGRLVNSKGSGSRDSLNSVRFELELERRLERLVSESGGPDNTECWIFAGLATRNA